MTQNNIIDNSDAGIVVKETQIRISDEKLTGMLSKAYEAAQRNTNSFRIHDLWGICWSISGTLLLSLLTSDFKTIGEIDSKTVSIIATIILLLFVLAGIILSIWRVRDRSSNNTLERDKAVDDIMDKYLLH